MIQHLFYKMVGFRPITCSPQFDRTSRFLYLLILFFKETFETNKKMKDSIILYRGLDKSVIQGQNLWFSFRKAVLF